ncbi:DNA-formamidopyrimidine glycosylase [Bacillus marinisedimentorum]|uniref:DNA-formamidopyrimidine glycosylase n=1 Tax=Bacillus marinisedimentorum TaxID=1821260 RepID=UPI0008729182|nr:DNA-formamidopyrimidine glycosylase [Bacillus marinisedimentorum]
MPELPEVETVKETLKELVVGKQIAGCKVAWPKMVKHPDDAELFCLDIKGQTIRDVRRRGKFLKFILDDDVMLSHLRMEGRYGLFRSAEPVAAHTHALFTFTDGTELRYQDVRKFGTLHLFKKGTEEELPPLSGLGPEPLSESFAADDLERQFRKTSRNVKTVLLDQRAVAGLGNIYVDEALFRAGIMPDRPAAGLTKEEVEKLHLSIKNTLSEAVDKGGSTVRSYVNTQGKIGMFQLEHFVYARNGEPCRNCGKEIEKKTVGGRGTHYCPACQE